MLGYTTHPLPGPGPPEPGDPTSPGMGLETPQSDSSTSPLGMGLKTPQARPPTSPLGRATAGKFDTLRHFKYTNLIFLDISLKLSGKDRELLHLVEFLELDALVIANLRKL